MTRIYFIVIFLFLSNLGHGYEALRYQGFFNTGVAWSSTKWPYEKDKWDITNKASFAALTNAGLSLGTQFAKEFVFESQISTNTLAGDVGLVNDYAFLRFQPSDHYHVSAGRLRNETLFYSASEKRSIAHPWTIPPAEVYGINRYDHYEGLRASGLYSYQNWDFSASLFAGHSKTKQESGSTRDYLGIMGVLIEIDNPVLQGQLSYSSYRTNDPDLFWSERRTQELSISLKTDYHGITALTEFMNHTDMNYILLILTRHNERAPV
ncbi:hypothetical protein [Pseudobacteriovorax antillogorgiicola]|uniref:Uncharacterized protein n=1 Tax=Pseudobacteriovorax antillogorgiicola TaxID=1513793 RepID=A0A1Y6CU00_9BACT|nr:hypothetical protein [Pseudobacteriovorax antillogorgiicola]TCS44569.1 hypothetical protein EDD56_1322 [Pseudobacteriovorax antillogorgiicola]SMF77909.1 hypothetical protein SAMN06296036_1322 [Pseudobacteriovorax antillogorgiicola]